MPSNRYGMLWRVVLIALVGLVMIELARTGIADFLRLEPCTYLDAIQLSGNRPDPVKLGAARDRLELAKSIDPDNPIIHEYLGIVYFYRAMIAANDLPLRIGYLESARDYYTEALKLRPNSGYLWAGAMAIHGALLAARNLSGVQEIAGSEAADLRGLSESLRHATSLAPWEVPVLNIVVKTGRLHYQALGASERGLVDAAVGRARQLGLDVKSAG